MIVKFFISDTCSKCLDLKHYFKILSIQYAESDGLMLKGGSIELYDYNNARDKPGFLYYNIQQIPCVIVCENDGTETNRFVGEDCVDKLKVLI